MASVQDLVQQINGQKINTDGADNGQCTAIPHLWERDNGWPIVLGNAKDTYANAPTAFYDKTVNIDGPNGNYPIPGAIIVWDSNWGQGFGHTAVVVSANVNTFQCAEQNDGDFGLGHVGEHNYKDTIGWYTARVLESVPATGAPASSAYPRTVPIHAVVNVRTAPYTNSPVIAQLHVGTCVVTAQAQGDLGRVGTKTSNVWYKTLNGHWFNSAATL